ADGHAEERADGRAGYDDEPEVDVDAAHDERCGVAQHVDVGLVEEAGHQPAGDVPADRPESDEAEVEQSGVADDDIETECRHDPDQRLVDRDQREPLLYEVVHRRVEVSQREHVVEDERPDRQRGEEQRPSEPEASAHPPAWLALPGERFSEAHTFSPMFWPSRPVGLNTMSMIRIANTTDCDHS